MADLGLGGYKSINAFVEAKLRSFEQSELSFASLFRLMFREHENVMYERSEGYRIVKTTYGEAHDDILKKAETLRALCGSLPGDAVIGLCMQNSLDWIEAFWAILAAGFRPLLVNYRLDDASLGKALSDCGAAAVISDGRRFSVRMLDAADLVPAPAPLTPGRFGSELLVMSSGTSSHVKICAYTAEEFYYQISDSYEIIQKSERMKRHYEGELKQLTFLPFYHVFGLIAVYIWFAFFSRTFVHLNDLAPQTIVNTIRRHKVTHIFAVPLFWEKVYDEALRTIRDRGEKTYDKFDRALALAVKLSGTRLIGPLFSRLAFREVRENLFGDSVSFMIAGGSAIDRRVMEFFNGVGYHLADGYGATEIGITSVELSPRAAVRNACFVGAPMSHAEYRIDENGELLVRGRTIARYVMEDGARREADGWFNTHDLAECVNGRYRILGRRDDIIIAADGENLNPNLIEPQLSLPNARGVCLTGAAHGTGTTPVLLVSVNRYISPERLAALDRAVRDQLAALGLSSQIHKVEYISDALMREDEFKLNRLRIARDYAEGRLTVVDPSAPRDEGPDDRLAALIRQSFAASLGKRPEDIAADADFFLDEGGTSLDYFAMMSALQEALELSLPAEPGKSPSTVRELYDYIKAAESDAD